MWGLHTTRNWTLVQKIAVWSDATKKWRVKWHEMGELNCPNTSVTVFGQWDGTVVIFFSWSLQLNLHLRRAKKIKQSTSQPCPLFARPLSEKWYELAPMCRGKTNVYQLTLPNVDVLRNTPCDPFLFRLSRLIAVFSERCTILIEGWCNDRPSPVCCFSPSLSNFFFVKILCGSIRGSMLSATSKSSARFFVFGQNDKKRAGLQCSLLQLLPSTVTPGHVSNRTYFRSDWSP